MNKSALFLTSSELPAWDEASSLQSIVNPGFQQKIVYGKN